MAELEEGRHYGCLSIMLGLVRCLTLTRRRVSTIIKIQTISDESNNTMHVILNSELKHSTRLCSKQRRILTTQSHC
jgi:hypothetical protein